MYRKKHNQLRYRQATQAGKSQNHCPFCHPDDELIIKEGQHFFIRRNRFPYDLWDRHQVEDHLMIIPKAHLTDLHQFTPEMSQEYFDLLQKYMKQGYDSFTRSANSQIRSQMHVHTHLIKTQGELITKISIDPETGAVEFS